MYKDKLDKFNAKVGKPITDVKLEGGRIKFTFDNGSTLAIYDGGQTCCESRYMVCDDDLPFFIGASLVSVEVRDGSVTESGYIVHEIEFLDIQTTKGLIQCATHNEHNGYYGGFSIQIV